jgi:hypothetical protein
MSLDIPLSLKLKDLKVLIEHLNDDLDISLVLKIKTELEHSKLIEVIKKNSPNSLRLDKEVSEEFSLSESKLLYLKNFDLDKVERAKENDKNFQFSFQKDKIRIKFKNLKSRELIQQLVENLEHKLFCKSEELPFIGEFFEKKDFKIRLNNITIPNFESWKYLRSEKQKKKNENVSFFHFFSYDKEVLEAVCGIFKGYKEYNYAIYHDQFRIKPGKKKGETTKFHLSFFKEVLKPKIDEFLSRNMLDFQWDYKKDNQIIVDFEENFIKLEKFLDDLFKNTKFKSFDERVDNSSILEEFFKEDLKALCDNEEKMRIKFDFTADRVSIKCVYLTNDDDEKAPKGRGIRILEELEKSILKRKVRVLENFSTEEIDFLKKKSEFLNNIQQKNSLKIKLNEETKSITLYGFENNLNEVESEINQHLHQYADLSSLKLEFDDSLIYKVSFELLLI